MTTTCRVLPHENADGPRNMALDEALLDLAAADPSAAFVRTYEWSVPTLSLGYFQAIAEVDAAPRWLGVPIVRRPTGGGALWHDTEVTYSVVVPGDHPAARPSRTLYATIHRAIADHLRSFGMPAGRRGELEPFEAVQTRPFLCFTDRDPEDIVFRGAKIVGSAQRRRAGAVLQHGSLLLRRSPATPELPGLIDLAPAHDLASTWAEALRTILPIALGLEAIDSTIDPQVEQQAQILQSAYSNLAWTRRR